MSNDNNIPWQENLFSTFPKVFKNLKYLECEQGWLVILKPLCLIIEQHIEHAVPDNLKDEIYATQIKEKFGGLRFYMNATTPYINGAVAMAESISYLHCEYCGLLSNRSLPQKKWIKTFCDSCYQKYEWIAELKIRLGMLDISNQT